MNRIGCALHRFHHYRIAGLKVCSNPGVNIFRKESVFVMCHQKSLNVGVKTVQKKVKQSPRITLLQNNSITSLSLEDAYKLAKRRDLQLIKLDDDVKNQRPIYKLVTPADLLAHEMDELKMPKSKNVSADKTKTTTKKSEKSLTIGSRISENDLGSRLKNISKWLTKRHEVRILIQGQDDDATNCEGIVTKIENIIKEPKAIGKIVQKRVKGSIIKFTIVPVSVGSENEENAA